jgi:hypothetical protein
MCTREGKRDCLEKFATFKKESCRIVEPDQGRKEDPGLQGHKTRAAPHRGAQVPTPRHGAQVGRD